MNSMYGTWGDDHFVDGDLDVRYNIGIHDPQVAEQQTLGPYSFTPKAGFLVCTVCDKPIDISVSHWQQATREADEEHLTWQGAWHDACDKRRSELLLAKRSRRWWQRRCRR